jgi:23S rRNA (uracil1939-C5)-methyltransferase
MNRIYNTGRNMTRTKAILLLVATSLLWSLGGMLVKLTDWNPIAIAGGRSSFTAILLWAYLRRPKFNWSRDQILCAIAYAGKLFCKEVTIMVKVVPVKEGDVYTVDIQSMGTGGEGIARVEGFTIFVEDAVAGDRIEARITELKNRFARAKIERVVTPSSRRTEACCPVAMECGGCQIQHVDYGWQLDYKTSKVAESLERIGGLEGVVVHPAIGMDRPWRYRNKAQFPVAGSREQLRAGFFAKGSHNIVEAPDCPIQHGASRAVVDEVREHMLEFDIPAYDEATGEGFIRHIVTRAGFSTGEIMVVIVATSRYFPGKDRLVARLVNRIDGIKSIVLNINDKKTNVIMGREIITLWGSDHITDYIGDLRFRISPLSFFQVNPIQTRVLYDKAVEYAGLSGHETVIDAYCGAGTISLFLAKKARKVYGIEVVEEAVNDARTNAQINGIENVEFIAGQAEQIMPQMYKKGIRPDVIVVDPPRKGCDQSLLDTIASMQPGRVVYVSCNPATLARDLKYLASKGYRAVEAQPVDMFPHTVHVECVVLMTNVKNK